MFENFCSDIVQTMKYFALESFNLICQAEHTKIDSRLNFNPRLALIAFWTSRPRSIWFPKWKLGVGRLSYVNLVERFSIRSRVHDFRVQTLLSEWNRAIVLCIRGWSYLSLPLSLPPLPLSLYFILSLHLSLSHAHTLHPPPPLPPPTQTAHT